MSVSELVALLRKNLRDPEVAKLPNGAILICRLPLVGTDAFLHTVFSGVSEPTIRSSEDEAGNSLHPEFSDFLRAVNGLILFQGAISIFGVRSTFDRSKGTRQPFDIWEYNPNPRHRDQARGHFCIGSYNWDGSRLYLHEDASVSRRSDVNRPPLNVWPSLEELLTAEVERISKLFDDEGQELDASHPTCPQPLSTDQK